MCSQIYSQRLFKGATHCMFHLRFTYKISQGFLLLKSRFLVKRKKIHDPFLPSPKNFTGFFCYCTFNTSICKRPLLLFDSFHDVPLSLNLSSTFLYGMMNRYPLTLVTLWVIKKYLQERLRHISW